MKLKFKKLILGDLCLAGISFYLALLIRFDIEYAHFELFSKSLVRPFVFMLTLVIVSYVFDLYSLSKQHSRIQFVLQTIYSASVSFLILSSIIFLNPDWMIGRGLVAISLLLFLFLQTSWHIAYRKLFDIPYLAERIIIIGTDSTALQMADLVESAADSNHRLEGFVTYKNGQAHDETSDRKHILGSVENLLEIVSRCSATTIIVSNPQDLDDTVSQHQLLNCKLQGLDIIDAPTYFEMVYEKLMLENLDLNDLIYSSGFRRHRMGAITKRIIDITFSIIGIILTVPLLPFIILSVKLNSPGPVLYRQTRVGHNGQLFEIMKFRTMDTTAEDSTGPVWVQENDERIRPIGGFLRKFRFDEIPQLYNVLLGNMSFIGPRPERPEFVEMLEQQIPFYGKRHFIKPGITGWAQIKHHYGSSVEDAFEKLRYDLYYFKHMNPVMDAIILLRTIKVILSQFGGR